MTDKEKIKSNNYLIGKALDSLDQCRFKNKSLLDTVHRVLNIAYGTKLVAYETDYKANDYPK